MSETGVPGCDRAWCLPRMSEVLQWYFVGCTKPDVSDAPLRFLNAGDVKNGRERRDGRRCRRAMLLAPSRYLVETRERA